MYHNPYRNKDAELNLPDGNYNMLGTRYLGSRGRVAEHKDRIDNEYRYKEQNLEQKHNQMDQRDYLDVRDRMDTRGNNWNYGNNIGNGVFPSRDCPMY